MNIKLKNLKKYLPIILTIFIFIFYLLYYSYQKSLINHDATLWINYGIQIFEGGLDSFKFEGGAPSYSPLVYTPGYPFFIGLFNIIIDNPIFSAYLVTMIAGALVSLTAFYIARELFNEKTGYIALLLCGFYTLMVSYAVSTLIRTTAILFLLLGTYLFLKSLRQDKIIYYLLSGLSFGIAILTRFEFAIYPVIIVIIILIYNIKKRISADRLLYFVLSILLIYTIYAIPLYKNTEFKFISPYIGNKIFNKTKIPKKPNKNIGSYKKLGLSMRSVLFNNNTVSSIRFPLQKKVKISKEDWERYGKGTNNNPAKNNPFIKKLIEKYISLLKRILPHIFRWHIVGFFLMGIFYCIYKKQKSSILIFVLIITTFIIYPLGSTWSARYYSHLIPIILIISSYGIYNIAIILKNNFNSSKIFYVFIILIIVIYFIKDIIDIKTSYTKQELVWLKSAQYLKKNAEKDDKVLSRKSYPAFYSGLRSVYLPDEDLQDVWEYSDNIEADYLIIDNKIAATLMPQYKSLLNDAIPDNLELVKELYKNSPYHARIFKIK